MTRSRTLVVAAALVALLATACGSDDSTSSSDTTTTDGARTVEIEMRDNKYSPDTVSVQAGETVRFVFTNNGDATHDAYLGDMAAQDDHEMEMRDQMGGHGMDDEGSVTVKPGKTGELTHTFDTDDAVLIGCHEPGHYEGGMRMSIDVT